MHTKLLLDLVAGVMEFRAVLRPVVLLEVRAVLLTWGMAIVQMGKTEQMVTHLTELMGTLLSVLVTKAQAALVARTQIIVKALIIKSPHLFLVVPAFFMRVVFLNVII
jgi:hypothetical protein